MSNSLNLLFTLGRPFSPLYSLIMRVREKLYSGGVFRSESFGVPVISIGNLMLGGTGKSPTVSHTARILLQHDYRPAIISRGYRGKAADRVNVVSDGKSIKLSAHLAGDEPYMLAENLPTVPVLTGRRRRYPCRHAVAELNADVLVLDDAFQHLGVKRDIDIVLFDGTTLAGNSRIFPGGPLREPVSALKRCHAFLITGTTAKNSARVDLFSELLTQRFSGKPVFRSRSSNFRLILPDGTVTTEPAATRYFAFCGIANPSRFNASLVDFGAAVSGFQAFRDHVIYDQAVVNELCRQAERCGAEKLITTEKDFVKLKHLSSNMELCTLQVDHQIDSSFDQFIIERVARLCI